MAKTNSYLKQRDADREKFFTAGCDLAAQQMFDMMCLALHDPEVMGKNTFGKERLIKLHKAMYEYERQFHEAWIHTPESDYYQEQLDGALREIFGEIDPFNARYPYTREWNYNKPMKGAGK